MSNTTNETRLWAMDSLCRSARTLFSENEPKPDVFPQQDGLNGWPFVVTAYNGIELALKALLAAETPGRSNDARWDRVLTWGQSLVSEADGPVGDAY